MLELAPKASGLTWIDNGAKKRQSQPLFHWPDVGRASDGRRTRHKEGCKLEASLDVASDAGQEGRTHSAHARELQTAVLPDVRGGRTVGTVQHPAHASVVSYGLEPDEKVGRWVIRWSPNAT
jgi:hypothetical protein